MRQDIENLLKGGMRQEWRVLDFNRVKKLWSDYARLGFVRDAKGMAEVANIVTDNIIKVGVNTELCGHEQDCDRYVLEEYGFTDWSDFAERLLSVDHNDEYFRDNQHGQLRISDYAMKALNELALKLLQETAPEKQLFLVDRVFNVVHFRSDIASWFLPNGSEDLNELSELIVT
jgi:hypothetical protein